MLPLVILGSARKQSDTQWLVNQLYKPTEFELLDLLDYRIYPYHYRLAYPPDDQFKQVAEKLLQHQEIIFATPVYWYAMSGLMKVFFDRLTNLTDLHKAMGKQLKGRTVKVIAVGSDPELPPGFEVPFQLTAQYFGMQYRGAVYKPVKELNMAGKAAN